MDWDAIVIGSGFGGAVTAARLAERGLRVLVLERGPWWGSGGNGAPAARRRPFPRGVPGVRKVVRNVRWGRGRRARNLLAHADGLFEWQAFDSAHAFVASGVGGGSLVYTNIQQQPDDDFFAAFPPELTAAELAPYFGRVRGLLQPSPAPHPLPKAAAFAAALRRTGLGAPERPDLAVAWGSDPGVAEPVRNAAGVRQASCVHAGNCVLGCEYAAKTTLDLTYIPLALRHGAELRALCEVVAVGRRDDGYAAVWVDHVTGRRWRAAAPRLVLAAGTLGTVRLLLEARDRHRTLPRLPATLGSGFTTNGDQLGLLRAAPQLDSRRGPTITAHRSWRDDGAYRFVVGEAGLPLNALPLPEPVRRRLARTSALFGIGRERATAQLRLDGPALRTTAGRHVDPELYEAMEQASARIARGYEARRSRVAWPRGPGRGPLVTVHPLGGAALAASPVDGVVDHTGQVFGHPGLYIADGSLYPQAPGLPPSMTIAALAERQAALMT